MFGSWNVICLHTRSRPHTHTYIYFISNWPQGEGKGRFELIILYIFYVEVSLAYPNVGSLRIVLRSCCTTGSGTFLIK